MGFNFSCCKKEDKQNEQDFSRNKPDEIQIKYETIDDIEKRNLDTKDNGNEITNISQNKTIDNYKNSEKTEENNENSKNDVLKSLTYNDIKDSKNINMFNCRKSDDEY